MGSATGGPHGELVIATVRQFARAHPEVSDPDACRDTCVDISDEFVTALSGVGVEAWAISGVEMGEVPFFPGRTLMLGAHVAVQVDDVVYDWTARQFDPDADVPLIQSIEQWQSRWQAMDALR